MRNIRNRVRMPSSDKASSEADDLKNTVRNALLLMTWAEQIEFIQTLELEMRRADLSIAYYLIPLGIPGRGPEELTPTEVGHLVRFLTMHVHQSLSAVERAMVRLEVFREDKNSRQPLAA